jgi:N-acetylneuraminic acid mutarotase
VRAYIFLLLSVGIVSTAASEHLLQAQDLPPLPVSVTNNAVTTVATQGGQYVVSFSGLGSGKTHADVHSRTFVLDDTAMTWTEGPPVPGGVGRLASAAATIGDLAYVFGGYTVAEDGSEVSTPWVHAFDPINKSFTELAAMPVPVDDSLALSFAYRFI